jgi:hypothetical protein
MHSGKAGYDGGDSTHMKLETSIMLHAEGPLAKAALIVERLSSAEVSNGD